MFLQTTLAGSALGKGFPITKTVTHYWGRPLGRQRKLCIALAVCLTGFVVLLAASSSLAARSPAGTVRLDRTFGDNGRGVTVWPPCHQCEHDFGADVKPVAVVAEPSGRIIVAASLYNEKGRPESLLAAYTSTGAVDPSFGQGGLTIISDSDGTLEGAAKQPDGKIVLLLSGRCGTCAVRFDANGMQDLAFGTGGVAMLESAGERLRSPIIAAAPGAKTVVAASVGTRGKRQGAVVRLNPDGSRDLTFGEGGQVRFHLAKGDRRSFLIHVVDVQRDGRILLGGNAETQPGYSPGPSRAIYRLKENGQLDGTFGRGGRVSSKLGPTAIEAQKDGKVLVAGNLQDYTCRDGRETPDRQARTGSITGVARYLANGRKDHGFGINGFASLSRHNCRDSTIRGLFVEESGEIIAGGDRYFCGGDGTVDFCQISEKMVAGFTRSGRRDMRFGPQGMDTSVKAGRMVTFDCGSVAKQEDGKILMLCGDTEGSSDEALDLNLSRFTIDLRR